MAQADYIISNQTFPNTRADINSHLQAIATNNSGTSAPTTQYAGQFWIDTTSSTWTLYIHDGSDDIQFATIDTSANTVNFVDSALDVVTDSSPQLGGNLDLNSNNITGTGNINITGTATVTGLTTTGDINLGDNDKIKLGASNDLQIYHNGSKSLIYDSGAGDLEIRATNILIADSDGTSLIYGQDNAEVNLYYNGSNKFQTTSTGVNVTGRVTSDALTVSGSASTVAALESSTTSVYQQLANSASSGGYIGYSNDDLSLWANASYKGFLLDGATNDISFYEDTGTTPKFFWDASTERLGIGTTSPNQELEIRAASPEIRFSDTNDASYGEIRFNSGALTLKADVTDVGSFKWLSFDVTGSERMRIDSSGRVGIGTTSPSAKLEVNGDVLIPEATLTDGATISWDVSTSPVAKVTLGGNRTLSAPSNSAGAGQFISLLVIQDGTGSRTLTWNAVYEFASDTAPTLTTTGGQGDLFVFRYNGTKWLEVGRNLNLSLS